ncbi:glycosyltransferase family 2 protein [Candidatus Daviesbacteria bacterium]|nr:glycosyltransferase family 2 protein [Candidatus Daviesbacteria bacterium]
MSRSTISIILATFNSAKTLPLVLESIKKQTYPKSKIEILLVDGDSMDKTISIGKKFGCKIIKNPRTEPVYGKFLGYKKARGKYIMYLDHDEVLLNKKSLERKIKALESNPEVKAVAGGNYQSPSKYPFINDYINEFGDPFSFFIYRLSKSSKFFVSSMKNRYPVEENKGYIMVDFSNVINLPIIEQVAGGALVDAKLLKKEFPETKRDFTLLPHFFYLLKRRHPYLIVMKNDPIVHYSSDSLPRYLKKITWRVKNNILFKSNMGESGFRGRERFSRGFGLKKYLFLSYAFSFIFPAIDAIYLSLTRKNFKYFIHIYLVLFTASEILHYSFVKVFGANAVLKSYDDSKIVKV